MAGRIDSRVRIVAAVSMFAVLGCAAPRTTSVRPPPAPAAPPQVTREQYGRLPLSFERNQGQSDPRVDFLARGGGYTIFLTHGAEAVMALSGAAENEEAAVLRLALAGTNREARASGHDELPGKVNYLLASDREQWKTGIATFAKVAYENVYRGIDVVYYGNQQQLEYDFVVKPGADPRVIALDIDGADRVAIDAQGDLVISVGNRELRQRKPVVYQERAGVRRAIEGRYAIEPDRHVSFHIGDYDTSLPLVIDPVLVYSTYLGGAVSRRGNEDVRDVAIDAHGNAYVTGMTVSSDFPVTSGAFSTSPDLYNNSIFVSKLNAAGTALLYSTLLGGSLVDTVAGIAVDPAGNAYLTGTTKSSNFPVTPGAFSTTFRLYSQVDGFLTKLDPTGAALVYSTFFGGFISSHQEGTAVAVDAQGHAYVTGHAFGNIPTTDPAFDRTPGAGTNGFVTKFDLVAATLVYSTLLGGDGNDDPRDIAVDANGHAYVTGYTESVDFPTTPGAFDPENAGGGFITKLDAAGASLLYSTFLDGARINSIAADGNGNAYVTGSAGPSLPTTPGAFDTAVSGQQDAFVTKINAAGAALVYSTFLGGDTANGIAVDAGGSAYVAGTDESGDVPVTPNAIGPAWNGDRDAFAAAVDSFGATLVYATYLGGSGPDEGSSIAVDGSGAALVVGSTSSSNFPTTPGAFDAAISDRDGFAAKIGLGGTALLYSTLLGGTTALGGHDKGVAIAVDASGSAYVAGSTLAIDFPTGTDAFDGTGEFVGPNSYLAFVTKLDPAGTTLIYSTYLAVGDANGIAVDPGGHAYVTGSTNTGVFLVGEQAFVAKLNPLGTGLIYSRTFGGSLGDVGLAIAVDAAGNAYVTGFTTSYQSLRTYNGFPTTPGAFDPFTQSNYVPDAFVTKFDAMGSNMIYSTLLGGSGADFGRAIAVDAFGMAYVTGFTTSPDFPTTPGAAATGFGGAADAFVTKFNVDGSALVYSTFVGGAGEDHGWAIAVDAVARAHVTGFTRSDDFPTTPDAVDRGWNGGFDAFVTELDTSGAALAYSSYLGGSNDDLAYAIALDSGGGDHLTGVTFSADFPTTANALDLALDGNADAWVARLEPAGAGLTFSTYFGGTGDEIGQGIAVGGRGDAYVTGWTFSSDFPVTHDAFDTTYNIAIDAFVARISGSVAPVLTLTPTAAANTVGQPHCVVAAMTDQAGLPLPGMVLRVSVQGANSAAARATTGLDGTATFCYTGTRAGYDAISFYADTDDDGVHDSGEVIRTVAKVYNADAPIVTVVPAFETRSVGEVHCAFAIVHDRFDNRIPGVTMRFSVTGTANNFGSQTGDRDGQAIFCYFSLYPGLDTVFAYADLDDDNTRDVDEPAGSAQRLWVIPPSSPGCGNVDGWRNLNLENAPGGLVISVRQARGAPPEGTLTITRIGLPRLEATAFFSLVIVDQVAIVFGEGRLDGGDVVPFVVGVGAAGGFRVVLPGYVVDQVSTDGEIVIRTCE